MDNLTLHIEYLLLRHDCVVVPGIGAFINVRESARFDAETNRWFPPEREVRFNSALLHDDGLLASSYARKFRIPFEEGREELLLDVDRLRNRLDSAGEITLGSLGSLHKEEGCLTYHPRFSAATMAMNLGFHSAPGVPEDIPAPVVNEQTVEKAETDVAGKKERVFDTRRNYYIAVNKIFARTAACLALVAAAALSVFLPVSNRSHEDRASVVPVEKIIRKSAEAIAAKEPAAQLPAAVPALAEKETEKSNRYYLIVATFRSEKEAGDFISANAGSGYNLEAVKSGKMCRVAAQGGDSREEMVNVLNSKEFQQRFKEAWIWTSPSASLSE